MSILTILTLVAVALVVLVLVVYLLGIASTCGGRTGTWRSSPGGCEAVQGHARPLPEHLGTVNGALRALRDDLRGTDRHLEGVGRFVGRD